MKTRSPDGTRGLPVLAVAVFGVGGLIACAVGLALFLGLGSASRNTRALWAEQADTLIESMESSLAEQLAPVVSQGQWIRDRVASGALDLSDRDALDQFMFGALAATPQVAGIAWLAPSGLSRRWGRDIADPIEEDWSRREAVSGWLDSGRGRDAMSWQSPFWTPTLDTTVLLHDAPLTRDGEFLGMLGQVVPVASISLGLVRDYAQSGIVPFVLHGRDRVLAHPRLRNYTGEHVESADALPALEAFADPVLARIWSPDFTVPELTEQLTNARSVFVEHQDVDYLFLSRTLDRYGPEPWTMGVYIDTRLHGEAEERRIVLAAGAGLVVLLVAVAIAVWVGLRISRRVGDLSIAARGVESGDFDSIPAFRSSGIREIDDAARAFGSMVEGLRERDLIRDTLGRFVPQQVALGLLDSGGRLEPRATEATVLFCDIEGFTALTEALGPHGIVSVLNDFFSQMVSILEHHGGVVTQFQGDAILATFNVPLADADHAANALAAALEMKRRADASEFAGHRLGIRIGINTGSLVAGAVGAEGRLNYTVHGDAVNLAARLESLNKAHGTRILASEHTAALVGQFDLREVEQAEVRGQSRPVRIYEVRESADEAA